MKDYKEANIWEIKILEPDNHLIIKKLYDEILHVDEWWHFFYEDSYMLVRFSVSLCTPIEKFLEKRKIQYHSPRNWIDNIPITKEYQEQFAYIFHAYSVLAMKTQKSKDKKIRELFDRITHCFLNNVRTKTRSSDPLWEINTILRAAVDRAYTIGWYTGKRSK
jgi:hypothetical protein